MKRQSSQGIYVTESSVRVVTEGGVVDGQALDRGGGHVKRVGVGGDGGVNSIFRKRKPSGKVVLMVEMTKVQLFTLIQV